MHIMGDARCLRCIVGSLVVSQAAELFLALAVWFGVADLSVVLLCLYVAGDAHILCLMTNCSHYWCTGLVYLQHHRLCCQLIGVCDYWSVCMFGRMDVTHWFISS